MAFLISSPHSLIKGHRLHDWENAGTHNYSIDVVMNCVTMSGLCSLIFESINLAQRQLRLTLEVRASP
jgi:hypothetical protein